MVGMALVAEPLVLTLVGEQWLQTVPFLQILCVSGALYHLHSINLNVLKVVGRSDLFLKLALIKKAICCSGDRHRPPVRDLGAANRAGGSPRTWRCSSI